MVLAIILATLATVGVFLYSRGVKQAAREGSDLVTIVVSDVDIPANSELNQFINEGDFTTLQIPKDAVVQDAVTQISQDRKSTRLNSSHSRASRMPSSA